MGYHYSDPTANAAIGTVDREIRRLRKRAEQIRRRRQKGFLTKQEEEDARREFVGIYRRFLLEALEDHV
jgi:hypothetical protein